MKPANDILFATVDSLPEIDKSTAVSKLLSLPDRFSWWDDYRYTKMIPLMTKNGDLGKSGTNNLREGEFSWTPFTPEIIKNYFEEFVFPWLGCKSRLMALITEPNIANNEHIDCNKNELNTMQNKFRYVLQGKTDTLYWLTDKDKVHAPDTDKPFVMDGGWPHGMVNTSNDKKVTLALGAPWIGKESYDDITILQNRSNYRMPDNFDHLWSDNS